MISRYAQNQHSTKKTLFDAGFGKRSYHYFNGRSRFDPTVLGWAGLTKGSVEEVLDKVRNHKEDDVIEWIGFDFKNKTTGYSRVSVSAQLNPQNCYTVKITNLNRAGTEGLRILQMNFKTEKKTIKSAYTFKE